MENYTDEIIQKVWNKAIYIGHNDPNMWRKDKCGAWIGRHHYGEKNEYGWGILEKPGSTPDNADKTANLIPLQWRNLEASREGKLTCKITASEKNRFRNVEGHAIEGEIDYSARPE